MLDERSWGRECFFAALLTDALRIESRSTVPDMLVRLASLVEWFTAARSSFDWTRDNPSRGGRGERDAQLVREPTEYSCATMVVPG